LNLSEASFQTSSFLLLQIAVTHQQTLLQQFRSNFFGQTFSSERENLKFFEPRFVVGGENVKRAFFGVSAHPRNSDVSRSLEKSPETKDWKINLLRKKKKTMASTDQKCLGDGGVQHAAGGSTKWNVGRKSEPPKRFCPNQH
jgi:hypothetical protein